LLAATYRLQAIRLRAVIWLRADTPGVNNGEPFFTSIVNRSGWIAPMRNYTSLIDRYLFWSATEIMAASTGDKSPHGGAQTENPSAAARFVTVGGNRIDSRELFSSEREIIIAHGDEIYRLRLTSQNKLILTK
jgi:hemin uptake protein HemP